MKGFGDYGKLAAVMLLALGLRLGWGLRQGGGAAGLEALPDQREYLQLGQHLRTHQGLWFSDPRFRQVVYAYRTPGYPLLVAACAAKPPIIRVVQAALDASSVLAIFLLARKWLGGGRAMLAALLVAVNSYLIFFTGTILSETLFTALLCWGVALIVLSGGPWPAGRGRLAAWLGGGVLLALAVLVRPGAIALPVILGCAAALLNRFDRPTYRTTWPLPVAATMLLLTAIVLFPWAARNRFILHRWIWTSTNAGITRYDGFNPDATGASDQSFTQGMPWLADMSETARSQYLAEKADEWMTEHPAAAMKLAAVKIARTWSPMPLSAQYGSRVIYVVVGLCFAVVFDLLVIVGLCRRGLPGPAKAFLLLPAVYFTVAAALSVGSLRYLVPAEAPMAIVAAAAVGRRSAVRPGRPGQPQLWAAGHGIDHFSS
ncbi:MAG: glycosyltransferase family 39 protein [Tepidisphaeraceae bacterium]